MLDLVLLPDDYAVCRLERGTPVPPIEAARNAVVSVTHSADEVSVICPAELAPPAATTNTPWRCLQVAGPVDFALTGILASLVNPLAEARVNIFAFSTYDTDYILVPTVRLAEALTALSGAGHRIAT
ncbi:ACT domain-containing protein [Luedemannella helvata]|uniref:ACT domain-containing protein n=1 Tax=Luedemannella helvata TaxID=349315 RepID=UPI0031D325AF